MSKLTKREQIIEVAFTLFGRNGFYATGVDLIMKTTGVSKRTLYRHFPSKNNLIVAVLDYYRSSYKNRLDALIREEGKTAQEKIIAIFDDARSWFQDRNFHGYLAVNAMGEFSGKAQEIESACQQFKQWELEMLRSLAKETGVKAPDDLAYKLFVILEGMASIAQVTKGDYPVDLTKMVCNLIEENSP